MIAPQTEADPMAILLQAIVTFGATVGRGPHVRVEGDEHHTALYTVIVGESSKARKGTSAGRVREVFSRSKYRLDSVEGLSSGEGLKYHVRDPREEPQYDKKTRETELVLVDPGVTDKRLLVVESEFAQASARRPAAAILCRPLPGAHGTPEPCAPSRRTTSLSPPEHISASSGTSRSPSFAQS